MIRTYENPYPEHPYPVGLLEYPLEAAALINVQNLEKLAMLAGHEPELLYDIPRILGGGDIANLGHSRGGSAFLLAHSLKFYDLPGSVLSVDAFEPMPSASGKRTINKSSSVIANIKRCETRNADTSYYGLGDRVKLRRMTTQALGEQCRANGDTFRFVFIDADHSYEGVLGDFKLWSPMVEVGGFVGFHDTNQEFTHRVLVEQLFDNPEWAERTELHVYRIRIFERRENR